MATPPLVELRGVRKSFGSVDVVHGVDLDVVAGEVHVLAGENGAGKSTLVNILSGVHRDYQGELVLRGEGRRFSGPADAARAGIVTIHQELSLVPTMSVADNLFLGNERTDRWGRVDASAQEREAARLLREAGLEVSPRRVVADLPVSSQQMLEIVRALAREASLLILDEPTSALSEREAEVLFARVEALRAAGRGIVYITHRMEEIYRLADRITVLRDGVRVSTTPAAELPPAELVARMVGRTLENAGTEPRPPSRGTVLTVNGLRVRHRRLPGRRIVDGVSLRLQRGEILGLAGLQGSGASEVLHTLFGDATIEGGAMALDGSAYAPRDARDALGRGVALLTADRKGLGLAPDQSVTHSVSLASLGRWSGRLGWVDRAAERAAVADVSERLRLRAPSLDAPVRTLSGGNQQKAYLARCMLTGPSLLLLDEPTRGIDVGAKADIYALVRAWSEQGISILLITSELDELLLLCHRILVMHRGRVTAELDRGTATKGRILAAAMGHAEGAA